jgi:endonuclease-8
MPEGDTIHYAANRIRPILAGRVPDEVRTPHPRLRAARWPERLAGREVLAVDAHGKHLFVHFEGELVIHSHLRMTGSWGTYRAGERWRRSPRRAWLVLTSGDGEVVQFDGPVLELMTESRTRFDQRIAGLGPDIIKDPFDEARFLRRLREEDPTRPIGDVLLQQQVVAGIGNLWKVEGCWAARVDPWRPAGRVSDDEVLEIIRGLRPRMQRSALDGDPNRDRALYRRAGMPCPRCGSPILERGQWEDNRATYWCPGCQR